MLLIKHFISYVFKFKVLFYIYLNRTIFKLKGVKYGKNMRVYNKFYLRTEGKVSIGNNFTFTSGDCINPISRNIKGCIYSEPNSSITIGNRVGISSSCIRIKDKLVVGNNVMFGANCLIIDNDAHQLDYMARMHGKKADPSDLETMVQHSPVIIEDDVWIGTNCMVLKGVIIGARSVIGAGSVVTKSIPPDSIAAGNPCRVIRHKS